MHGSREFVLYVNYARSLKCPSVQADAAIDTLVKVYFGDQAFQTALLQDGGGANPVYGFEKVLRFEREALVEFESLQVTLDGQELSIGFAELNLQGVSDGDWHGDIPLRSKDRAVGMLNVGVEWLSAAAQMPRPLGAVNSQGYPGAPSVSGGSVSPRVPAAGDSGGGGLAQADLAARLATIDGEQLNRYAVRLSEVVMQLHASRREDWSEWRARENALLEEVVSLQRLANDRQKLSVEEVRIEEELRRERRKRIDAETKLTLQDRYRQEAVEADRLARGNTTQAAISYEAEANECRVFRRQAGKALQAEQRAVAMARLAEEQAGQVQEELVRQLHEVHWRAKQSETRTHAAEAAALGEAWRCAGELRGEMQAWETHQRGGRAGREALDELQGIRRRVDELLKER
eukprot:TRINITY_DN65977_c0_g1_i1.p1 TRINITY_DN65977_c0_g1~~TRINITY_DN65977_c0_g1_i1.p1  ORF type:complete len:404 (-),score=116.33 TRINITY_DN65977_c0_g1_i1:831-2042(-)